MKHTHIYKLIGISIVFSLCSTLTVTAEIVNSISISSNTGGNTAESGTVIEGKSESSIDSVTIINGEVVEEIHKTATSGSLYVENTVISNDGDTSSETHVFVDGDEVKTVPEEKPSGEKVTTNIISFSEEHSDVGQRGVFERYSLFATIFMHFSRTINHVLSNLI